MKFRPFFLALLLILSFLIRNTGAQEKVIILDQPETGTQNHIARDLIQLLPGFRYTATGSQSFTAKIDNTLICDVDYIPADQLPDPDNRQLDLSLPVGFIAVNAGVSQTGAATCQIPIMIPPGTAGMQPEITIEYNSQSGNGLLGWGWNISGVSAITRVPQTIYHDGTVKGVELNHDDRFALNGNRLIAITGDYGQDGTEYRTEQETFNKVISHGIAGSGPQWFEVQTKNGLTIEYGNTNDSRIEAQGKAEILVWNISKVKNNMGNYIKYFYVEDMPH